VSLSRTGSPRPPFPPRTERSGREKTLNQQIVSPSRGAVYNKYRQHLALDLEHFFDLFIIRAEILHGSEEAITVGGGFLGVDYSIGPTIDVNLKYAVWSTRTTIHLPGIGFSYNILPGAYLRFADTFQIIDKKVVNNEFQIQIYIEFLGHL